MKIIKNIPIEGQHNRSILTDVFYRDENRVKPLVIFVHGYKGFKDWGCWNLAAQKFAAHDFFFIKFNFSHNGGTVEQPIDFPDLEAFGNNNYSIEMDDLDSVINWVIQNDGFQGQIDRNRVILIGHSRGGGIAMLKAYEDKRISKLITWAGVSDFETRFPKGSILKKWEEDGVIYIENMRTKQKMPHYFQFYENFVEHKDRFNIAHAAAHLQIPHLIIHGDKDETVPFEEALFLHDLNPNSTLSKIAGGNHTFGCSHPWKMKTISQFFEEIIKKSIDFVLK